jgi:Flp pilus assembly protein TadG
MTTGRERGGGAVTVPMAVAMLALLAVVGLAVDGARAVQQIATADAIAEEAGRAGGQALDMVALQRGQVAVDTAVARAAVQAYLADAGASGEVTVLAPDRIRVEVTLSAPTVLLGLVGIPEITASGSAEADLIPVPADAVAR